MKSWLEMVEYDDVGESCCMRRVGFALGASRAAFLARRPVEVQKSVYYTLSGEGFPLARARWAAVRVNRLRRGCTRRSKNGLCWKWQALDWQSSDR